MDWIFTVRESHTRIQNREQFLDRANRIRRRHTQPHHGTLELCFIDFNTHTLMRGLLFLEVLPKHLTSGVPRFVERRSGNAKRTTDLADRAVYLLACQRHYGTLGLLGSRQGVRCSPVTGSPSG